MTDELDALELPIRATRALRDAGLTTIEKIRATPRRKLLSLPNFGAGSLHEVMSAIAHLDRVVAGRERLEKRCDLCRFWHKLSDEWAQPSTGQKFSASGECRIRPPQVVGVWRGDGMGTTETEWPHTGATQWCGCFMKKEEET